MLLDLDPTVAGRRIEVQTPARISLTGPEDGAVPLEVYEDGVGCEYKHTIKKVKK